MSTESFEAFMAELSSNEELKKEARELAQDDNGVALSALARFAADHGYDFSSEDVSLELDEQQLDSVSGGLAWQPLTSPVFPKIEGVTIGVLGGKIEDSESGLKIDVIDPYFKF